MRVKTQTLDVEFPYENLYSKNILHSFAPTFSNKVGSFNSIDRKEVSSYAIMLFVIIMISFFTYFFTKLKLSSRAAPILTNLIMKKLETIRIIVLFCSCQNWARDRCTDN